MAILLNLVKSILLCVYYVQRKSANTEVETCCLSERERATIVTEPRRRGVSVASVSVYLP